ncbi:hypothetical protein GJ744_000522 [Endocarpon pusillum]|uniref:Uncharacterized protein n=1 Tax=Endocarpon pusillum TaxID=364733 RepID=A0A8H7ABB6_9EURO|nr:hypothetical protein GJ744_000522 [Endocarpon pusillum]
MPRDWADGQKLSPIHDINICRSLRSPVPDSVHRTQETVADVGHQDLSSVQSNRGRFNNAKHDFGKVTG